MDVRDGRNEIERELRVLQNKQVGKEAIDRMALSAFQCDCVILREESQTSWLLEQRGSRR